MKEEKDMNEIPEEVRILQGLDEESGHGGAQSAGPFAMNNSNLMDPGEYGAVNKTIHLHQGLACCLTANIQLQQRTAGRLPADVLCDPCLRNPAFFLLQQPQIF